VDQEYDGTLTPEMRIEVMKILRSSGDGLSHGATFQLQERGLDTAAIADSRGVSVEATRGYLRSIEQLCQSAAGA
jgi:hypothetical protein